MSTITDAPLGSTHHIQRCYRLELDGLRALAVAAVLINHAHPSWLPGGFLGVDLFFVLSGYVVARSWRSRSAPAFYRRRLRRLQPALIVCLAISAAIAAPLALLSGHHSATALAALVGASNLALLSQSLNYFGPAASLNPFTHTWSLGVEEQFYLLFPLLIRRSGLLPWLTPASLLLWLVLQAQQPEAAFFLMPSRLWELGFGILLFQQEQKLHWPRFLPWLGLAGLLAAFSLPQGLQLATTPLAALSSAALIGALLQPSLLQRLLRHNWPVAIGQRAYGLYLWHWPLLVYGKALWPHQAWLATGAPLLATALMAWASYRWLEQPLRHGTWGFRFAAALLASGSACISGAWLMQAGPKGTAYERFSRPHQQALAGQPCHSPRRADALQHCLPHAKATHPAQVVLLGDSHAGQLRPVLLQLQRPVLQLSDRNLPNLWLGRGGCKEPAYCVKETQLLQQLRHGLTPGSLVVLSLSSRRLSGPERNAQEAAAASTTLEQALAPLVAVVQERRSQLLLVGSPPQITCPQGQDLAMLYGRGGAAAAAQACSPTRGQALRLNQPLERVFQALAVRHPQTVTHFNSLPLFCGAKRCHLQNGQGQLLFWDDLAHLTPAGLQKLRQPLLHQLEALLARGAKASP